MKEKLFLSSFIGEFNRNHGRKNDTVQAPKRRKEEIYGQLVAPNTIGINHDHFITYYLDLDIDGQENSFLKTKLKSFKTDGSTPRKSYWSVVEEEIEKELDARLRPTQPMELHIVNPNKKTAIGNKVG